MGGHYTDEEVRALLEVCRSLACLVCRSWACLVALSPTLAGLEWHSGMMVECRV